VEYFHRCVSNTILGRDIEESWRLWGPETAQISLTEWAALQRALVSGWRVFVEESSPRDRFWAGVQLAFHAYGYGGNIRITIGDSPPVPEMEETREEDKDDTSEDEYGGFGDSELEAAAPQNSARQSSGTATAGEMGRRGGRESPEPLRREGFRRAGRG
jgi:hypothetical protein